MEEILAYRQALLSALLEVVDELAKTVTAIPTQAWYISSSPDSHTPHFTLAHLRELEAQVFARNLQRIQAEDGPGLPLFDDEAWMARHYQPHEAVQNILNELARMRKQEVSWLRDLPAASWSLTGRHPRVGVRTLQWWVELQLDTSRQHVRQITSSLASAT